MRFDFRISMDLIFCKTLKICTRRFRRNLDMGFFSLKSSKLLKDFLEMQYKMPQMQPWAIFSKT
jgi:hypothetical protein